MRPGSVAGSWLQAAIGAALLAGVYFRAAAELWTVWLTNDNYSHGPLVPVTALVLVWLRRRDLAAAPLRPDPRGVALIALACLMIVFGMRADLFALEGYSILPMLWGMSLAFFGGSVTRVLAFPIGYLVFMLTFPPFLMNTLSYALKEITVRLSTQAAEMMGVTLQRSGMTLYLESGVLRMENPCSGLRSLLALLATGAVFAHLQPGGWVRRALVLAAAVPIAMFGNACRITLLILIGHYVGVKEATGAFHDWSGYVIYLIALAGLMGVRAALLPRGARERA
ncbi:MAG: exosortase/archaeosortase family protein [Candidatus Eisenbacteria bacterium]|nr:exosortase/archaeosortase family protein [Candidatus Eisenbacteria bacterium]